MRRVAALQISCYVQRVYFQTNRVQINEFFSLSGFFFTDTDDSQDSRGRVGTIFYSTLTLPPAHEHSDIYLQLCMWNNYHIFLFAPLVFTRSLLDEIYHLIEPPFDLLMMWYYFFVCLRGGLVLGFCYSKLTRETGGLELESAITLFLQGNRLTKCASYIVCLNCNPLR